MLASATLTTVLSRNVRNNSVHREARARGRRREPTVPTAAGASASAMRLAPADSWRLGACIRGRQLYQPAETGDAYLPDAVKIDRCAHLIFQERGAEEQDPVVHRGLRGRGNRH